MSSELSMPLSVVRRFWTGPVELRQDNQDERDARRGGPDNKDVGPEVGIVVELGT